MIEQLPFCAATESPEETEAVGTALAEYLKSKGIRDGFIAMRGDLGAGKTAFTRGFARVFCPEARVKSPTFAIVNVYRGETVELELTFDAAPADTMNSAEEQPPQQTVPNYGGYYSNPWDLFNSFFGYGW